MTSLSSTCLSITSRESVPWFPWHRDEADRLVVPKRSWYFFIPFSKMGATSTLFLGSSPVCYGFSNIMPTTSASSLRSLGYISSGPIDCAGSSSSGRYEPDLWLQVEWLCFSSPSIAAHPLRRCGGKKCCLWSLWGQMLNTSAFSLTVFDHVLMLLLG